MLTFVLSLPARHARPRLPTHATTVRGFVRCKRNRALAWVALFGNLFALEVAQGGWPSGGDATLYKASALFSLLLFVFLPGWALATFLSFVACFAGWQAFSSEALTGGMAMVVVGISPVLAFIAAFLERGQTASRRPHPDWFAEDPFFDDCGRRR